jgi:hypothetical protein
MKIKAFTLIVLSLLLIFLNSCSKEERANLMTQQESQIESYIKTLQDKRVEVLDGVWRVVFEEGSGNREAASGDSVVFNYAAYIFSSGKGALYDTNVKSIADEAGIYRELSHFVPKKEVLGKGRLLSGLEKGLISAKPGESSYVIFSARHGFGNVQTGLVPKMSPLLIEVWLIEVKKN